ncbi:hypothetical protein [Chitinophaga eiseniae]|uniref:Uncharacterized protein n=1 Tax=Chitinophaga eiseniae TaxID=634771 RepID=A0A847S813_9BACT|nr:hypothetical protein [Chitinophaga eiseniae]NLR77931.1 hypothetical protein [Chitinophaga eiseniae]
MEFTKSFKNEIVDADSLIHFDGYYYRSDNNGNGNYIVFYKNGLVGYGCGVNYLRDLSRPNELLQFCSSWGTYSVSSDTIKIRCSGKGTWMVPYDAIELWFLIKDKEHFEMLVYKDICYPDYPGIRTLKFTAVYVPSNKLPTYEDCWLLKEKWFWKNENDWKRFVDNLKKPK